MATIQQEQQNCMQHFWQRIKKTEHSHECVHKIQIRKSGYPTLSYNLSFGAGLYTTPCKKYQKNPMTKARSPLGLKTLQADSISTNTLQQSIRSVIFASRKLHVGAEHQHKAPQGSRIPGSAEVGPPQRSFCCWQISQAF